MRRGLFTGFLLALALVAAAPAPALIRPGMPREDVIWARVAAAPLTLDGVLNEASWAKAESTIIKFGRVNGIPGSGWKIEAGGLPQDSTRVTIKWLARDNQLYLGVRAPDKYIGGSSEFNRFDGLLMGVKNHLSEGAPKAVAEYFYAWWYPHLTDPQPVGQLPRFIGLFGEPEPGVARTPEAIAAWDAVTVVRGKTNSDSTLADLDEGYTVEMRFDCTAVGYDITRPEGDTFEWNISIYDCDGWWPLNLGIFSSSRVWWQGPWGNSAGYNEVRVMSRPDVTVSSGAAPPVLPEVVYPRLNAAPTIDGNLNDAVWSDPLVYSFDIRYGDDGLRQTYPAVGPYVAGEWQPEVNGGLAYVVNPGDATVRMFVSGDRLYVGYDVRDEVVQYHTNEFRWDGFWLHMTDIDSLDFIDHTLNGHRVGFQVGPGGSVLPKNYLINLISLGKAQIALYLKPGTTVDTLGIDVDAGYSAEMWVDLTELGYTPGAVSGPLFLGVVLLDGDSYLPITDSYGTKTWWFREYDNTCCPSWGYISSVTTGVEPGDDPVSGARGRIGSFPNPSLQPHLRYNLPERSRVTLEIYDLRGRLIERRLLGTQEEGERTEQLFGRHKHGAGVYVYRLRLEDPATGQLRSLLSGKTVLLD